MICTIDHISERGIWLSLSDNERFLSFEDFPWFQNACVSAIQKVELLNEHHLYWSDLDIDLAPESIENPERFPLVALKPA